MLIRRVIRLFVILCSLLGSVWARAQFTCTTNIDGTLNITSYTGAGGTVSIPDTINGLPVTSIGSKAFYELGKVSEVIIPNSVLTIGNMAFEGCGLTNVSIGNHVVTIGNSAFQICVHLTSVAIPSSVTSIGIAAFADCFGLRGVSIGNSVTNLGDLAFSECPSLTSLTLPDSVLHIGMNEFTHSGMTNIDIGSGVSSIADLAFSYCTNLVAINVNSQNVLYSSLNGVLYNKNQTTLVHFPDGRPGSFSIPNGVTTIDTNAFAYSAALTSVILPDSVSSIAFGGFSYCSKLTSLLFKGNAPSIAGSPFFNDHAGLSIYYLPNRSGWSSLFAGYPAYLWNPQVQTANSSFGVRTNQFGFTITGTSGMTIVVDAATNLTSPIWLPVETNTLNGGSAYFCDPFWTNFSRRFYRFRPK